MLRKSVFADKNLSLKTKSLVYRAVVLGVLLYGAENMTLKRAHSKCTLMKGETVTFYG